MYATADRPTHVIGDNEEDAIAAANHWDRSLYAHAAKLAAVRTRRAMEQLADGLHTAHVHAHVHVRPFA